MPLESRSNNSQEKENPLDIMGNKALAVESSFPRNGLLFRTTTVLALLMSAGIFSEKAEAQVRGVGPQGGMIGSIISQALETGTFQATRSMDKKRGQEKEKLEIAYTEAMHQLKTARSKAYWDNAKGKLSDEDYKNIKADIDARIVEVQKAYEEELNKKNGFRMGVFETILRGIQGY